MAHPGAHGLHQKAHGLARDGDMALDAQHVLLGGQTGDAGGQIGRVGDLGQVDDDGVEILMLVVFGAVVMAGAGVQVVLGGLAQAQDQARIDRA